MAMAKWRILVTAPYMLNVIDDFAARFAANDAEYVKADVGERLEEDDLLAVIADFDGEIAGAGLDVLEDEPLPDASPLRRMDNVLLAPHNANSSHEAWNRVHESTLAQLFAALHEMDR